MPKNQNKLALATGYSVLVKKIQAELSELDFFVRRRTAEAYWKVGKFIHQHLLENKQRADYGGYLFKRLAEDVGRDKSTLTRILQFYRAYPIVAEPHQLTWNHYRALITVKDKTKREVFEKKAAEREWTSDELEEAIRLDRLEIEEPDLKPKTSNFKLNTTRARLFTYQILEPSYIHSIEEKLVIDLGFNTLIHTELKVRHSPKANGETSPKSKVTKKDFGGAKPQGRRPHRIHQDPKVTPPGCNFWVQV